jgi:hypothetical protein
LRVSALVQTLIGATASIAGGIFAVRYQQGRTLELTAKLRREQRAEEALLTFDQRLVGIDALIRTYFREPNDWRVIGEGLMALARDWDAQFQLRITDDSVREKYEPVRRWGEFMTMQGHDPMAPRPGLERLRDVEIPELRAAIHRALA